MTSELRVDRIIPVDGVAANDGSGGLIQTRFTQYYSGTLSTTSTSFVDTGLHCSITPKSANSLIHISVSAYYYFANNSDTNYAKATIYRDSTNLGDGDLGNNATQSSQTNNQNCLQWYQSGQPMANYNQGFSFEFVDRTHNSTSQLTYKLYMSPHTAATLYFGWNGQAKHMRLQEFSV